MILGHIRADFALGTMVCGNILPRISFEVPFFHSFSEDVLLGPFSLVLLFSHHFPEAITRRLDMIRLDLI